jgi:hypothetical protein
MKQSLVILSNRMLANELLNIGTPVSFSSDTMTAEEWSDNMDIHRNILSAHKKYALRMKQILKMDDSDITITKLKSS